VNSVDKIKGSEEIMSLSAYVCFENTPRVSIKLGVGSSHQKLKSEFNFSPYWFSIASTLYEAQTVDRSSKRKILSYKN
jgi:hypothetical protein